MTVDVFSQWLTDLMDAMPEALFEGLNGGVVIKEEGSTLGEYCHDRNLGSWIEMSYSAFEKAYPQADDLTEALERELRRLLRQHMEFRAGAVWTGSGIIRK